MPPKIQSISSKMKGCECGVAATLKAKAAITHMNTPRDRPRNTTSCPGGGTSQRMSRAHDIGASRSGRPKAPSIVISGNAVATAVRTATRRELGLKELSTGDYRLVVRVRDVTNGREVTRERRIAVRR